MRLPQHKNASELQSNRRLKHAAYHIVEFSGENVFAMACARESNAVRVLCCCEHFKQTGFESGKRAIAQAFARKNMNSFVHMLFDGALLLALSFSSFARRSGCVCSCVHALFERNQASSRFMRTIFFQFTSALQSKRSSVRYRNHSECFTVFVFISFFIASHTNKKLKNKIEGRIFDANGIQAFRWRILIAMRWRFNEIKNETKRFSVTRANWLYLCRREGIALKFDIFIYQIAVCFLVCSHVNEWNQFKNRLMSMRMRSKIHQNKIGEFICWIKIGHQIRLFVLFVVFKQKSVLNSVRTKPSGDGAAENQTKQKK